MPPRLVSSDILSEDLFPMVRTPGRHVSTAIRKIKQRLQPERFTDSLPPQLRLNLGNAFERALIDAFARQYPGRYHQIGELSYRNVTGTVDLLDMGVGDPGDPASYISDNPNDWGITEVKLTWASARRADDIEDEWFWHYWTQMKAYVKMAQEHWEAPMLNRGQLIICFINGGARMKYKEDGPQAFMWEDRFDQTDIDRTWNMVEKYSEVEQVESAGKRSV